MDKHTNPRPDGSHRTGRQNMRLTLFILGGILSLALVTGLIFGVVALVKGPADDGRILPNVTAGGVNLGGMTWEEATYALQLSVADTLSQKQLVVELPGSSLSLSPENTHAKLDVTKLVGAAYSYGRTGSALEQRLARLKAQTTQYVLPLLPYLELDRDYILSAVEQFCDSYSIDITQPTAVITGERPVYTPPQKAEPEDTQTPVEPDIPAPPTEPVDPNETVVHQVLTITTGTPQFLLECDDLYAAVLDAYSLMQLRVNYKAPNRIDPEPLDLQALFNAYCVAPQDAVLDEDSFQITPEVVGYGFDVAAVQAAMEEAGYGKTITISLGFLMPDITEQSFGELFQDVLATYTSNAQWEYDPYNRNNNLKISCEAINGTVVKPGESFDFNKILGPRTLEKGYLSAPNYQGSTLNSIGGGISQTASALHYCALLASLKIVERHAHPFSVSYTPLGTDAAITYGKENLIFTNTTAEPIRVLARADGGRVTIQLLGTETREYTPMVESDIKRVQQPQTIYQSMDKNNVYGYTNGQVLQAAHTGYTIEVYYCRYDSTTMTLIGRDKLYDARYEKHDQVVVRIEGESMPTDPATPTTPEPSQPNEPEPSNPSGLWP